ncbi:MAG: amidohydrolase family protein, partial [Candidatus Thorarchaeota archaeon]|nr:amidohydrolase family protein [Candidatus Thorarchaeota archaeon]
MKPDLLLTKIGQLATLAATNGKPKTGEEMRELSIVEDGAVAIKEGLIVSVGTTSDVLSQVGGESAIPQIELPNMMALPGFVDSHTHLAFGGSRENDFAMKLAGKTYMEILEAGGGILNTLRATRAATKETLTKNAFSFAERMLSEGTTTVEAKSGYGLNTENELKILQAIDDLHTKLPMGIASTFLGAHA